MERQLQKLITLVKMLDEKIEKTVNQELQLYGVTFSQFRVIALLYRNRQYKQDYTMKELEHIFQVSQQTMVGIVFRLERKKMLTGFHDAQDKRVKRVRLTEHGKKLCEEADEKVQQLEASLEWNLTEEERRVTISSLRKIYDQVI